METLITDNDAGAKKISRLAKLVGAVLATLSIGLSNGCSVYLAAHQPDKKDITLLKPGTPRSVLVSEFGQPASSETRDGKRVDIFTFVQGYSEGAKTSRAVWHGVADVFTLGLWEVIGYPVEKTYSGEKMTYEVTYDADNNVEKVVPIGQEASAAHAGQSSQTAPASEGTGN